MAKKLIRKTKQRQLVFDVLNKAERPLNAEEITQRCNYQINISTVYRTLNTLAEMQHVSKHLHENRVTYFSKLPLANNTPHKHEHRLICSKCLHEITFDTCPINNFQHALSTKTGFIITEHQLKLIGICPKCHSK